MKSFYVLLIIFWLIIPEYTFSQTDTITLTPNVKCEGFINKSEIHLLKVNLQTGEFVRGFVDRGSSTTRIRVLFPDGSKIRSFGPPSKGKENFRFVAEVPGNYLIELTASDTSETGKYLVMLEPVQSMEERLKISPDEKYFSPKIDSLIKKIKSGNKEALEKFWSEVTLCGTPLFEPYDTNYSLVTFLWRETYKIFNVLVIWSPYSTVQPEDYKMHKLPDTDVWYKTLRVPKHARFLYQLSPNETLSRAANSQRFATSQFDPLNPKRWPIDPNLTKYEVVSIAELPDAPAQPYSERLPNVPNGHVEKHIFNSSILNNQRTLSVYTPFNYKNGFENNLLILFDEDTYLTRVPSTVILDNLIAQKRIPATVAVLINYPPGARDKELFCNIKFAEMLEKELLPWIHNQYSVTTDPGKIIVGGLSGGGLAATFVALRNPNLYGNVLAQSGSFWYAPHLDQGEEPNWIARQYIKAPKVPLKFYIDCGLFENDIYGSGGQILETSRHLRDILRARGYEVFYNEFAGGHDYLSWRGTLADGLQMLIGINKNPPFNLNNKNSNDRNANTDGLVNYLQQPGQVRNQPKTIVICFLKNLTIISLSKIFRTFA